MKLNEIEALQVGDVLSIDGVKDEDGKPSQWAVTSIEPLTIESGAHGEASVAPALYARLSLVPVANVKLTEAKQLEPIKKLMQAVSGKGKKNKKAPEPEPAPVVAPEAPVEPVAPIEAQASE